MSQLISPSHPWINFTVRMDRMHPKLWILLGECASKIAHMNGTPLMPAVAEEMRIAYLARGVMSTAAIEGNTLTVEQVEKRMAGKLALPPSQEYLGREIDNLQRAYDLVADGLSDETRCDVTEAEVVEFKRTILDGLTLEDGVRGGEYTARPHGVGGYRAPSPQEIRELMPKLVEWINGEQWYQDELGNPLALQILRAIIAHLYIAWIHPFGDGNGRTARMLEADILARAGVPAISYHLLSTHYNQTRSDYYRVLSETSAAPEGNPLAFVAYALQGLVDGLRQQIASVKEQHRTVVWRDYVHDALRGDTPKFQRLRRLAIDLAGSPTPVKTDDLWLISRRVAAAYQGKTAKTVTRDIHELSARKLIIRRAGGWLANLATLQQFVSPVRDEPVRKPAPRKSAAARR